MRFLLCWNTYQNHLLEAWMSDLPNSKTQKLNAQKPASNERISTAYQFANNPAMRRSWVRNLLFGFAIAMPLSLYGLEAQLWQAKDLLSIYGIVVVTCLVLLPIYTAIVRELG